MEKVQVIAHESAVNDLLAVLQEVGIVQLEEPDFDGFGLRNSSLDVSDFEHTLFRLNNALDYFSRWEEGGLLGRLFVHKPQLSLKEKSTLLSSDYSWVLDEVERLEAESNELMSEIRFLEKERDFLMPFKELSLPVSEVRPTESTEIFLGFLPSSQLEELEAFCQEEALWFSVVRRTKREAYLLLFCLRKERELIEERMKDLDFNPFYFSESILERAREDEKVAHIIEALEKEISKKRKKLKSLENAGKELSINREKLMSVYDILTNEKNRALAASLLGETERTIYLEGWIRSRDKERLKHNLSPYAESLHINFRPPLPEEDPPSILENPKPGQPFEILTRLYGLPQRGALDPTLPLAPFFFVFVGLCVSEAGYGFLVALLSILYLKLGKPKGGLLQFLKLMVYLGISTVIFGTLIGSWFGFPLRRLMVLDPLKDPFSFLIIALVLGLIQVWFGTLLKLIQNIKSRNYLDAFFVQGGWLVLLPSLVLVFLVPQPVWKYTALAGAAGIVFFASPSRNPLARFFGGLYSLYDISRYLSDVLSYSRLLALGLATTVIAMVVNTICQTVSGIPVLGWLLAALVFIGGHLFNLGISFLGGFVHSMRLQFVEFFSKFFISGGRPFEPFEMESRYVEFI